MRRLVWLALVATSVVATGCAKNPYQMRQEYQAKQAEQLRPAELEHGSNTWRAIRTMRVRLYADAAAAKQGDMREDFEERLARANQVLESALRLRLVLEEVRDLPPQPNAENSDALLLAIEQLDPGADVDFVIALIGASPVVTLSFHDLGRARVLGKHIVLRSMDDPGELRALEGFDTLSVTERSRLYQQRKRHKETAVLLHEIGHALGALHTRDTLELMHATYDADMSSFAQPNLELMGYVVDKRAAEPSARYAAALLRRMADYLSASTWDGWVEDERKSQLASLERAYQSGTTEAEVVGPAEAAAPAAQQQEDLPGVSEADRARYLGLDRALQEQRLTEALQTVSELARAYPDSYPVQQKACQVGMQLGLDRRQLKGFCDRMLQLSMQPNP
jgi:hypothetical protein